MEGEHVARDRIRVGVVTENAFRARGDALEAHLPLGTHQVPRYVGDVAGCLLAEPGQGGTRGLCFDDADEATADEEAVVDLARGGLELSDSDTEISAEIDLLAGLYDPAARVERRVDERACLIFGWKAAEGMAARYTPPELGATRRRAGGSKASRLAMRGEYR